MPVRLPRPASTLAAQRCASLLRAQGVAVAHVRLVAQLGCEIWRVATSDGADLSLRIYPQRNADRSAIEAEVAWLQAAADDGLHVPRPLPDAAGRLLRTWQPDAAASPRAAVLLTWLGGRMHDRALTPARLRRVGVLTGRLHATAQRLVGSGKIATQRVAHQSGLDEWIAHAYPRSPLLGPRLCAVAAATATRLRAEIAALPRDASSWGFIHGDLHPWNLLFTGDVAGAIDFSECGWGHRAFELASTLQWLRHPLAGNHDHGTGRARLQDALLDGYASVAALPGDVLRSIDLFIVLRLLLALEWILDDWPAPDHRAWGPGFIAACEGLFERYERA